MFHDVIMGSKKHSAMTGVRARIRRKVGGSISALYMIRSRVTRPFMPNSI